MKHSVSPGKSLLSIHSCSASHRPCAGDSGGYVSDRPLFHCQDLEDGLVYLPLSDKRGMGSVCIESYDFTRFGGNGHAYRILIEKNVFLRIHFSIRLLALAARCHSEGLRL